MDIKPVEIVTISKIIDIFKSGEKATNICVVNFKYSDGSNCGYNLISQKGLYEIGDTAVYIQPDYCISEDISLFDSFTKPNGDPKKSRLGKNGRIRASKFNFTFSDSTEPIYSFGILLPLAEVEPFITNPEDLQESLKVIKYEEPESGGGLGSGITKGDFPGFAYKTDELQIWNVVDNVNRAIEEGEEFGVTIKTDGSSITQIFIKREEWETMVCSRNNEKSLDQRFTESYSDSEGKEYHRYTSKETKEKGWINDEDMIFVTDSYAKENLIPKIVEVRDAWVDISKNGGYLDKGLKYCQDNNVSLVFRGELCGVGLKGSGNKYNPDAKNEPTIKLFGIDNLDSGFSVRNHYGNEHNLEKVATELGLPYTKSEWIKPSSFEELIAFCRSIFKREESEGRIIEGVVIRTKYSNKISTKFLNEYYDSKK